MSSKNRHPASSTTVAARALPLLLLALLAIGTAVQVGCAPMDATDDTTSEDELNDKLGYGHHGYGYSTHKN